MPERPLHYKEKVLEQVLEWSTMDDPSSAFLVIKKFKGVKTASERLGESEMFRASKSHLPTHMHTHIRVIDNPQTSHFSRYIHSIKKCINGWIINVQQEVNVCLRLFTFVCCVKAIDTYCNITGLHTTLSQVHTVMRPG